MSIHYRLFGKHARSCPTCEVVYVQTQAAGRQSKQLEELYHECCFAGMELFAEWRGAVAVLRAAYREHWQTEVQLRNARAGAPLG